MGNNVYQDMSVRRRVHVNVGNKVVLTEDNDVEYNAICAAVKQYDVSSVTLDETHIFFNMYGVERRFRYVKDVDVSWVIEKFKTFKEETEYKRSANNKGVHVFTVGRSNGLVKAVAYALTLDPEISKQDDNVVITADTLSYAFNLNNLVVRDRKPVEDMLKLKRLEALAKKYNINI